MRATLLAGVSIGVLAMLGCEPKGGTTSPGEAETSSGSASSGGGAGASSTRRSSNPDCPASGPSVSINVRRAGQKTSLGREELGTLLGWIGGFVQPCIDMPSEAHHITLVFELGAEGEAPTYDLVEREELPGMAQCLDEGFAAAGPPPPGPMNVSIMVPWGCPTLGPGYDAESMAAQPESDESAPPADGS